MITKEKINIYISYHGDIDKWARVGSRKDKTLMEDEDWTLIENLLQDIRLVEKNLTSIAFSSTIQKKLIESCDSLETINLLKTMANTPGT